MNFLPVSSFGTPQTSSASSTSSSTSSSNSSNSTSNLANENIFLQLLVAQLKNQDPQNPADGTQFVTQLAQFTTLQEDTQSATDLDSIVKMMQAQAASNTAKTTGTSN